MCGILGFLDFKTTHSEQWKAKFQNAQKYLKYRGPDNSSREFLQFNNQFLAFAHNRLSIIDLSDNANQPFYSNSKNTLITFNGEIYNFQKLQNELISAGCVFRTNSDTEVIVNAYEFWGIDKMLNKLDGMFAFGLYDFNLSKLFLCRDRFGKKPLYFYSNNSELIFSSDIRSIKELVSESLNFDHYAFYYYLSELSTPKTNSIWKGVEKVPPASYLEIEKNNKNNISVQKSTYWRLNYESSCPFSFDEIVEQTNFLFTQAVKKRLVADVRVASLLSGGVDSSLVVATMAELTSENVYTYNIGFKESDFDESSYAKKVAQKFETNHTEIILEHDIAGTIDDIIFEYGEPFGDSSMIPTYLICKEVSKNEKVVLGGDGGDELFSGYDSYYKALKLDQVKNYKALQPLVKILSKISPSYRTIFLNELLNKSNQPMHRLLDRGMGFSLNQQQLLLKSQKVLNSADLEHQKIYNGVNKNLKSEMLKIMNASYQTRLLNDYLVKVDRASMFASLEMRSPFLDKDLVEFAATLKPTQLYRKGEPKAVLKSLALKYFDHEFVYRKKMGFSIPIVNWLMRNDFNNFRDVILSQNKYLNFDEGFLTKLINDHKKGQKDHRHRLWLIYVFNKWASFN